MQSQKGIPCKDKRLGARLRSGEALQGFGHGLPSMGAPPPPGLLLRDRNGHAIGLVNEPPAQKGRAEPCAIC